MRGGWRRRWRPCRVAVESASPVAAGRASRLAPGVESEVRLQRAPWMRDDSKWLSLRLDFWDGAVGAFEPAKVIRQLRRGFPVAEVDPTDHQRDRLLRELGAWSRAEAGPELRDRLAGQSWGT